MEKLGMFKGLSKNLKGINKSSSERGLLVDWFVNYRDKDM